MDKFSKFIKTYGAYVVGAFGVIGYGVGGVMPEAVCGLAFFYGVSFLAVEWWNKTKPGTNG
jgi:hypothetical protein